MANNLQISYDLYSPGQNYEKVAERIKSLGSWAKVHMSLWYVAVDHVKPALDANDSVYVVDATNNTAAWNKLGSKVSDHIQQHWNQ